MAAPEATEETGEAEESASEGQRQSDSELCYTGVNSLLTHPGGRPYENRSRNRSPAAQASRILLPR
jgi:hypothetical protein